MTTGRLVVAFASPLGLARDGVGIYCRELVAHLSTLCRLVHFPLDHATHGLAHFRSMAKEASRCDVLHVEHTHGFFRVPFYPFREGFFEFLRRVRIPRVVVYHEPLERIPVYFPPGERTAAGVARRLLRYAAVAAAAGAAERFWLPGYNRRIFSLPERVVVHTDYRAAMVRRFAPEARVCVVRHPVYEPRSCEGGSGDFRPSFPEGSVVVTVFGFIDHRKDYIGVLDALRRLPARFCLLVAGGCHEEAEMRSPRSPYGRLMAYARRHGLEERVQVTGFCPDSVVPAVMAATDIVVCPFLSDHSSGSINMALAYGRPVVAYRTLLTDEMAREGAGLILVEKGPELASALDTCVRDRRLLSDAVARGAGYRERNSFQAAAGRIAGIYREVLASP